MCLQLILSGHKSKNHSRSERLLAATELKASVQSTDASKWRTLSHSDSNNSKAISAILGHVIL